MTGSTSVCRRCDATLRWVRTRDGKAMPVNPVPDRTGNVAAMKSSNGRYVDAHVVLSDQDRASAKSAGYVVFRPHFADCQDSEPASPPPRRPQDQLF